MNKKFLPPVFALLISLVVIVATLIFFKQTPDKPVVVIRNVSVPVVVSRTPSELRRGLSGTKSLAENAGMLFVMPDKAMHTFWMPNMHYPLDLVWITDNKVADISAEVPNDFDPAHPIVYKPDVAVDYVLEVNAGFMARHGLKEGDEVRMLNI